MGKTITEKILARAAGRKDISPGEYIEVASRCPVTVSATLGRGIDLLEKWDIKVFNPRLINVVDGHTGSTASHKAGEVRKKARQWAKEQGVVESAVSIRFTVDPAGKVLETMRVERTSGFGRMDRLAMEHLKLWRFAPVSASEGNQWGIITFRFLLE